MPRALYRHRSQGMASLRQALHRLVTPEVGVGLLCLTFVGVTAVWLSLDQGTPHGNDASRHFEAVFTFHDHITPLYWFHFENNTLFYPPLVYLVGALGTVPDGLSMDGPVMAINLVFVPLYAAGCYGVAREAFGRAAGLPAAIFALAAPMAIGLSHLLLLDLPLAAMVAVTTWALLASNRFENARLALLAGTLMGLGMLTKQPFVVYVAPVAAVIVLRGGWRNWRGVALFCAAAAVIGGPWYIRHLDGLSGAATAAGGAGGNAGGSGGASHLDVSARGHDYINVKADIYEFYAWAFVNAQWYLPLTLAFVGGAVATVRRARRSRTTGYVPELIVGLLAGYVGVALLAGFKDTRYSFSSACFVAALGVGWIAQARPRVQTGATMALLCLLALNLVAISTGVLGNAVLRLPDGHRRSPVEGNLVLLADHGYTAGKPERSRTLDLLEAAAKDGVAAISVEDGKQAAEQLNDIDIFALAERLDFVPPTDPVLSTPDGITLYRRPVDPSDPPPCQRFSDGTGLYVLRGPTGRRPSQVDPRDSPSRYCPL